jgi:hypothetical protein
MCSSLPFPSFPPLHIPTQRPVILTDVFFWFSSVPPGQSRDIYIKSCHNRFLPHPYQFITHPLSVYSTLYSSSFLFFPEGGVGLVPKRGCLLTLAFHTVPRWYEFGERRWNDILTGENRRTRRETCPSATSSTINATWIDPGANPGLRCERLAINDLRHGTALQFELLTRRR